MKAKLYIYSGLLFLAGPLGMVFSKNLTIKSIGFLIAIVVCIMIYCDKEYRNKYLPTLPGWSIIAIILIILFLFVYILWLRSQY